MKNVGDLHNFGQAVRCITAPNGHEFFEKPRTLFWENLFFGKDSPLKDYLPEEVRALFGLEVEFYDGGHIGRSKRVLPAEHRVTSEADYFQFGILLGYSYTFGIQDLHCENVVKTQNGLQVIDAEVVLTKCTLPHETLLLPFRDTPFEKSALSHLSTTPSLDSRSVTAIINGFWEALKAIDKQSAGLSRAIEAEIDKIKVPIRALLRDTFRYRNWQENNYAIPLLHEEREQLERGDIPYFFKFPGGDQLFYYTTPSLEFTEVTLPETFLDGVAAIGVAPAELLTSERINGSLLPNGTLLLLRKLLPTSWAGEISGKDLRAVATADQISIFSAFGNFSTPRFRASKA